VACSPVALQALIDSPEITRTIINFKRLLLTDITVEITKIPNKKTLAAALADADVQGKFAASSWGKKLARQAAKRSASDLDRYRTMKAKVAKGEKLRAALPK
jgi:large subunit ribosomal protein L14e